MYDDILGPKSVDDLRKIKNRKFDFEPKKEKNEEDEFGIFEEFALEFDYE